MVRNPKPASVNRRNSLAPAKIVMNALTIVLDISAISIAAAATSVLLYL